MSSTEVLLLIIAVLIPLGAVLRFVSWGKFLDKMNEGLSEGEKFQLLGLWTPTEHSRLFRRWRQLRKSHKIREGGNS